MPGLGYEFFTWLISVLRGEKGQTMVEYALLLTVIALGVLVAATALGTSISSFFSWVAGNM